MGAIVAALGALAAWTLISPELAGATAHVRRGGEAAAPPAEAAREPVGA